MMMRQSCTHCRSNQGRMNQNINNTPGCRASMEASMDCSCQEHSPVKTDCSCISSGMQKPDYGCKCAGPAKPDCDCKCAGMAKPDCDCKSPCGTGIECLPLGISYVPMQRWEDIYSPCIGYPKGTIFEKLDLPFLCTNCPQGRRMPS